MKKLKLLVAALCLSGAVSANPSDSTTVSKQKLQQIESILEDLMSAARQDTYYGYLREERGYDYLNNYENLLILLKQITN
tara:strand:+ start:463 stop:702 length:240 start_codon:yes stop_codon:yes gene_type:complete